MLNYLNDGNLIGTPLVSRWTTTRPKRNKLGGWVSQLFQSATYDPN